MKSVCFQALRSCDAYFVKHNYTPLLPLNDRYPMAIYMRLLFMKKSVISSNEAFLHCFMINLIVVFLNTDESILDGTNIYHHRTCLFQLLYNRS